MRTFVLNGLLIGTAVLLSSCGKGSSDKEGLAKGQVVATVNGEDVTIYELGTELQGLSLPPGEGRKKAEQVALDTLGSKDKAAGFEKDFIRRLQAHRLTSDDPSVWQGRWQELRAKPAIKQAFDRLGRDLPPEFLLPDRLNASTK